MAELLGALASSPEPAAESSEWGQRPLPLSPWGMQPTPGSSYTLPLLNNVPPLLPPPLPKISANVGCAAPPSLPAAASPVVAQATAPLSAGSKASEALFAVTTLSLRLLK